MNVPLHKKLTYVTQPQASRYLGITKQAVSLLAGRKIRKELILGTWMLRMEDVFLYGKILEERRDKREKRKEHENRLNKLVGELQK